MLANERRKSMGTSYLSHRSPFIAVSLNGVFGNVTVACKGTGRRKEVLHFLLTLYLISVRSSVETQTHCWGGRKSNFSLQFAQGVRYGVYVTEHWSGENKAASCFNSSSQSSTSQTLWKCNPLLARACSPFLLAAARLQGKVVGIGWNYWLLALPPVCSLWLSWTAAGTKR